MVDVSVPSVISLSSPSKNVSLKILNEDDLPLSLVGTAILKPFNNANYDIQKPSKNKPNGIVYPTRRFESKLEINVKDTSIDSPNSNLQRCMCSNNKFENNNNKMMKELRKKRQIKDNLHNRKPFITTVKQGEFLPPCEAKFCYAYANKPRVLNGIVTRNLHKYYNCTSEPSQGKLSSSSMDDVATTYSDYKYNKFNRNVINHDCVISDKKAFYGDNKFIKRNENHPTNYSSLLINSKGGKSPYSSSLYLKDNNSLLRKNVGVQVTTLIDNNNSIKNLHDATTQTSSQDFIDYELEQNIGILIDKTIEQSLIEILQEEELALLKKQQNIFKLKENNEQYGTNNSKIPIMLKKSTVTTA